MECTIKHTLKSAASAHQATVQNTEPNGRLGVFKCGSCSSKEATTHRSASTDAASCSPFIKEKATSARLSAAQLAHSLGKTPTPEGKTRLFTKGRGIRFHEGTPQCEPPSVRSPTRTLHCFTVQRREPRPGVLTRSTNIQAIHSVKPHKSQTQRSVNINLYRVDETSCC